MDQEDREEAEKVGGPHQDKGHGQSQGVNGQLEQGRENDGSDPRAGRTDTDCNAKIPENKA